MKTKSPFLVLFVLICHFGFAQVHNLQETFSLTNPLTPVTSFPDWSLNTKYTSNERVFVASDQNGNTILGANIIGENINFGGIDYGSREFTDILLAKYDGNDNLIWHKVIGAHNTDEINDIKVDENNNIYITGVFDANGYLVHSDCYPNCPPTWIDITVDFDPENPSNPNRLVDSSGNKNIFLAKYNENGSLIWIKYIENEEDDVAGTLAFNSNNEIVLTGTCYSTGRGIDFDPLNPNTPNKILNPGGHGTTGFIAKYDKQTGDFKKSHQTCIGFYGFYSIDIAIDQNNNTYVTGAFMGKDMDFGDPTKTVSSTLGGAFGNSFDIYLAKYNNNGALQWVNAIGGSQTDAGLSVDVDHNGGVYLSGYFEGSNIDFDRKKSSANDTATSSGPDAFFAKYDSDGNFIWLNSMGGNSSLREAVLDTKYNTDGTMYIVGRYAGTQVDFGGEQLSSNSTDQYDLFLGLYNTSDGSLLSVFDAGSTESDYSNDITIDNNNGILISQISGQYDPGEGQGFAVHKFGYKRFINTGNPPVVPDPSTNPDSSVDPDPSTDPDSSVDPDPSTDPDASVDPNPANDSSPVVISPNPANEFIHIKSEAESNYKSITLRNSAGQLILHKLITNSDTSIDIRQIPSGLYFITLINENSEKETFKILKK